MPWTGCGVICAGFTIAIRTCPVCAWYPTGIWNQTATFEKSTSNLMIVDFFRLQSPSSVQCFVMVQPSIRDSLFSCRQWWGWRLLPSSFSSYFLSSLVSHYGLSQQSPNPSIFPAVLHSPPTLSRPLLTPSSHRILCLPLLPFLFAFWVSDVFVIISSPILSTWPAHFNLFLTTGERGRKT